MSYAPVPDVELGEIDDDATWFSMPSSEALIKEARARYPAAGTDIEAEVLGRLDYAIENCKPEIKIPRVEVVQSGPATTIEEQVLWLWKEALFWMQVLLFPTAALGVTLVMALIIAKNPNSSTMHTLFPFLACTLIYLAAVPVIRKRFLDSFTPFWEKMTKVQDKAGGQVKRIADKGLEYLGYTERALNDALEPIKEKLALVTQLEDLLQKYVDSSIDIPDITDLEKAFDGYEAQLKQGFEVIQSAINFNRDLPGPLQSLQNFQLYVVLPYLIIMFALELLYMCFHQPMTNSGEISGSVFDVEWINATAITESVHRVMIEISRRVVENDIDDDWVNQSWKSVAFNSTQYSDTHVGPTEAWPLIWCAVHSYFATLVTIAICFLITREQVMAGISNFLISVLEESVNVQLKSAVGNDFEDIFQKGFIAAKEMFLDLVLKIDRVEQPLRKLQSQVQIPLPNSPWLNKILKD